MENKHSSSIKLSNHIAQTLAQSIVCAFAVHTVIQFHNDFHDHLAYSKVSQNHYRLEMNLWTDEVTILGSFLYPGAGVIEDGHGSYDGSLLQSS